MKNPVLVVDASDDFCTLIRQTLEATGLYQVTCVPSGAQALAQVKEMQFRLAIVDFALPDMPGPDLIRQLRAVRPTLALIGIPFGPNTPQPNLAELSLDGVLSKPFYLPDLPRIVGETLGLSAEDPSRAPPPSERPGPIRDEPQAPPPLPRWLANSESAASGLARLPLGKGARAIVLSRGRQVWAVSGSLTRAQAEGLASVVADHWAGASQRGAVARFTRLPGSNEDLLIFASTLAGDLILILACGPDTPFGGVRRQAQELRSTLLAPGPTPAPENEPAPASDEPPADLAALRAEWIPASPGGPGTFPFVADIDLPPPDPDVASPAIPSQAVAEAVRIPNDWLPKRPKASSRVPFLEEAAPPNGPTDVDSGLPTPEAKYNLPFTGVFLPRFPEHRLIGPISERLNEWVDRVCVAWGWRAQAIDVQADYLCLTLNLNPETAPGRAFFLLRQELSQRILQAFPDLAVDLPSSVFWAPGYLLTAGGPPPQGRIASFIQDTRKAQGLSV